MGDGRQTHDRPQAQAAADEVRRANLRRLLTDTSKETLMKKIFALAALAAAVTLPVSAQVKVGIITGATGPGASLGIPYKNTFTVVPKTLGGQPVQYIVLDDATDPS